VTKTVRKTDERLERRPNSDLGDRASKVVNPKRDMLKRIRAEYDGF
jgi:hypothetical protein